MEKILREAYKEAIKEDGLGEVVRSEFHGYKEQPEVAWWMAKQMGCVWMVAAIVVAAVIRFIYIYGGY
jgi:hypothetical protein